MEKLAQQVFDLAQQNRVGRKSAATWCAGTRLWWRNRFSSNDEDWDLWATVPSSRDAVTNEGLDPAQVKRSNMLYYLLGKLTVLVEGRAQNTVCNSHGFELRQGFVQDYEPKLSLDYERKLSLGSHVGPNPYLGIRFGRSPGKPRKVGNSHQASRRHRGRTFAR
eukprot:3481834-Amphidinium_carterae.1